MLRLTDKQMKALAAERRARNEVAMVAAAVREQGNPAMLPPERRLADEVQTTLRRCDDLGLTSDADRITFCLWELTLFPGLRELPELPQMLEAAGGAPEARLTALFLVAPPNVWSTLMARGHDVRRERGGS